nr:fibronectin type III domain-containing protein [Bacteroidales bacterium]
MRKVTSLFTALLFLAAGLWGQTTVTLGDGTAANTTTAHPTPYGTYYKNHRVQYLILASELNALGITGPSYISAIGFNVQNVNTCSPMPNYTMMVKNTSAEVLTATFDNEGYTVVWTDPNFLPVVGWNTHTFVNPFFWDGVSNFLIDVCFDIIPGSYTQNASVFYTETVTDLASYYRSDSNPACMTINTATVSNKRANMQITYELASGCFPPGLLVATNITTTSADLGWTDVNTPPAAGYDIEIGPAGFTPTGVPTHSAVTNPFTVTGLSPVTPYDWYVRSDCGTDDVSNWAGPGSFTTTADPLSGNYTINSTLPTGGTNFNNFTDFATAINLGGFAGPVIVDVIAGTGPYEEQVILGELPNSSAVNTLTINGNGETLQYASTNTNERATLKLIGTDYVTINNLIIKALSETDYGFAVHLMNLADHNSFFGCQFIASTAVTTTSFAAFVTSNSATGATSSALAVNYLTVDNCTAIGGYYGLVVNGPTSAPYAEGNVVTNCTIKDFHMYGLYLRGQNNGLFSNNDISRPQRTTTGTLYMLYATQDMSGSQIVKNRIHDFSPSVASTSTAYGFYGTSVASMAGNEVLIANNLFHGYGNMNGVQYGIYLGHLASVGNSRVYHNTIFMDNYTHTGSSLIRGIYPFGAGATVDVRNNIVVVNSNSTGTKYCLYYSESTMIMTSNNNVLLMGATAGTNYIGYWNAINYITLPEWQATGYDLNSVADNPLFIDPASGNLMPQAAAVDNIGADLLAFVPDDFFGVARTTTPDPGAIEFVPSTCIAPSGINLVAVSANSATIGWTANGGESLWNLEWGPAGFTFGTGTLLTGITTNPYLIEGLTPETDYDVYLQADCGTDETSAWVGPFTFTTTPSCLPPTNLTVTNLIATSVTLNWTPGGDETMWNVEWGLEGFTQGSGTLLTGITNNFYDLTGLTAQTGYDFYVQSDCGSDALSPWAGPFTFTTPCEAVTVFPFLTDFENEFPPNCWDFTGGTKTFVLYTNTTTNVKCAEASFWGWTSGNDAYMTSPILDISALNNPGLAFNWSHLYNSTYPNDELDVLVSTDYGTTWTSIWNKAGTDLNSNDGATSTAPGTFVEERLDLSMYNTKSEIMIQFHAISGYGPDLFIDNIIIEDVVYGSLEGYVTEATRGPVQNAHVYSGEYSAYTDETGHYLIEGILPGNYNFTCDAEGYISQTQGVEIVGNIVSTLDFAMGYAQILVTPNIIQETLQPGQITETQLTI